MKKTLSKKTTPQPTHPWQTGAWAREASFHFRLPDGFGLLCRLLGITPEQMLTDFMDNLACGSCRREGRDAAKAHLVEYVIAHGYRRQQFSEADIRKLFRELDAVGLLFPRHGSDELIDSYTQWREMQYQYWFEQWNKKQGSRQVGQQPVDNYRSTD